MRVVRGLVQEKIVDDDTFHRRQTGRHMRRVRIGLENIFALAIECFEHAVDRCIQHAGNTQAGLWIQRDAPVIFKQSPRVAIADVAISRKFMRETAHVARALDVVLATKRIYADTTAANIPGCHRQIGDCHNGRAALGMLGDAKAVIDRAIAACCI